VGYFRDKKLMIQFGSNLKKAREGRGLSQEKLANELGFTQSQIANIESARTNTSISHAYAFAKALNIPIASLFEF
jgi:transcriptional regulator with XRE-family HTH domain